jgi:hypothetical protein
VDFIRADGAPARRSIHDAYGDGRVQLELMAGLFGLGGAISVFLHRGFSPSNAAFLGIAAGLFCLASRLHQRGVLVSRDGVHIRSLITKQSLPWARIAHVEIRKTRDGVLGMCQAYVVLVDGHSVPLTQWSYLPTETARSTIVDFEDPRYPDGDQQLRVDFTVRAVAHLHRLHQHAIQGDGGQ